MSALEPQVGDLLVVKRHIQDDMQGTGDELHPGDMGVVYQVGERTVGIEIAGAKWRLEMNRFRRPNAEEQRTWRARQITGDQKPKTLRFESTKGGVRCYLNDQLYETFSNGGCDTSGMLMAWVLMDCYQPELAKLKEWYRSHPPSPNDWAWAYNALMDDYGIGRPGRIYLHPARGYGVMAQILHELGWFPRPMAQSEYFGTYEIVAHGQGPLWDRPPGTAEDGTRSG